MCACNFDLSFIYIHARWEGSANNSRVMQKALGDVKYILPWPTRGYKINYNLYPWPYILT